MSKTWDCGKCGWNNAPHRRKCQTWNCRKRGPGQEDGGYWDCRCGCESNFASRSRCRSCGAARGRYQPQFTQSTFAAVVAEEAAKLHAQLGQDAIDVPMIETGPDEAPSEEAEREQLRTLLANLDASIAALTPGRGGRRGRVPDSTGRAGEAQADPGSALRPQKAQDLTQSVPRDPREGKQEVQGVGRGGVRHGSALGQAVKAKELGEVEVEARTAREGSAQSTRNSSPQVIITNESIAVGGRATECAGTGEVKESFNQWLEQFVSRPESRFQPY